MGGSGICAEHGLADHREAGRRQHGLDGIPGGYLVTLFVPLGVLCWLVAIESRFSYRFGELHRNALALTFGYLPQTAVVVGILAAALVILRFLPYLLLFLPAAVAHLQSGFVEKVFEQYMPGEEKED